MNHSRETPLTAAYSPLRGCEGDRVEIVVKVFCETVLRVEY